MLVLVIEISRAGKDLPVEEHFLMSPAMVAAAAINGKVSDVREFINK